MLLLLHHAPAKQDVLNHNLLFIKVWNPIVLSSAKLLAFNTPMLISSNLEVQLEVTPVHNLTTHQSPYPESTTQNKHGKTDHTWLS